ncbi:uncharacterized protein RBU33_025581 isoform 2-T3 [Hipposideros larvatus]
MAKQPAWRLSGGYEHRCPEQGLVSEVRAHITAAGTGLHPGTSLLSSAICSRACLPHEVSLLRTNQFNETNVKMNKRKTPEQTAHGKRGQGHPRTSKARQGSEVHQRCRETNMQRPPLSWGQSLRQRSTNG